MQLIRSCDGKELPSSGLSIAVFLRHLYGLNLVNHFGQLEKNGDLGHWLRSNTRLLMMG